MKKQYEYEQLAEKLNEHLKTQNQDVKNWDQVESSKLPEKYFRFNFVKPEPQVTKEEIDQKLLEAEELRKAFEASKLAKAN